MQAFKIHMEFIAHYNETFQMALENQTKDLVKNTYFWIIQIVIKQTSLI